MIRKMAAALAVISTLATGSTQASDIYAGINIGKSEAQDWVTEEDVNEIFIAQTSLPVTAGHGEKSDSTVKAYLGIVATPAIDIRLGYTNLGEATFKARNSLLSLEGSVESQGVFADVLARLKPAERFSIYGKLGLALMQTKLAVSGIGLGGYAEQTQESNDLVFVPGVGLSLDIASNFSLEVEYERYLDVGDDEKTGTSDVDVLSAGLCFHF